MSESGEGVHKYESTLRYLSSKSPLSERRLAIAPLKFLTLYDISMFSLICHNLAKECTNMKVHYVTSPLSLLSRRGDLPSLRSNF